VERNGDRRHPDGSCPRLDRKGARWNGWVSELFGGLAHPDGDRRHLAGEAPIWMAEAPIQLQESPSGRGASPERPAAPEEEIRVLQGGREDVCLDVFTTLTGCGRRRRIGAWRVRSTAQGAKVLSAVEGIYRNGEVELSERPEGLHEARVIVTFLPATPSGLSREEARSRMLSRMRAGRRACHPGVRPRPFGADPERADLDPAAAEI
jgi:hypothetical protein